MGTGLPRYVGAILGPFKSIPMFWLHAEFPPHYGYIYYPIPQGHPSAPALSALSHASNLDWRSVSHMIIYMFQCHSPKSSPTSLSHRVQKTDPSADSQLPAAAAKSFQSCPTLCDPHRWQPTRLPRGKEQTFGLCGRGRGWDDLGEWH